ncbi:MAG: 2-succinyl-5-enolpyruvyl-6-hydroxy-3-cyclohexene-1-carboxylic-acid synthase [Polyangiales bacterium]
MGTVADLQSQWARLTIDSFVRAGVSQAIISPGSRSTPFTIAALEHAGLQCHSALDERSAAHFALGQARGTLRPSLLICTSGSAAANYFPAVVEGSEAGVPLIVLSADRPPELHGCGANQTTDQVGLYGKHVRFFSNLGEPRDDSLSLRAVRRIVAQAVSAATATKPGPVHINAQARKPLEPTAVGGALDRRFEELLAEPSTLRLPARSLESKFAEHVPASLLDSVAAALDSAARPLILCGPADVRNAICVDALNELAERTGALVLAEASSQLRCGARTRALGAFDTIWRTRSGRAICVPDFVLQLGAVPTSAGWEQLCDGHLIRRIVVHPWDWPDPSSNAEAIVQADIVAFVTGLSERTYRAAHRDEAFVLRFERAESAVWDLVTAIIDEAGEALTEAGVARALLEVLPSPSALVLGNSLPIRDVDTWTRPNRKSILVHSQRGVSGIDGVVSGAAGVASSSDGIATLLIGDISFLHDLNGLQLASRMTRPMVIVVINNGGGRIFEQLPIAQSGKPSWLPYFTTPHVADLESAAAIYGCKFRRADTVRGFHQALDEAYGVDGCTVLEAVVPPHSALEQGRELLDRVERLLRREAP